MKLVIVIYDTPYLGEWILDDILECVEEHKPTQEMDAMFFEDMATVEFIYEEGEDLTDFALFLMLSFDSIEVKLD